jgi:DNA-binding FadR family transcriptional regulator
VKKVFDDLHNADILTTSNTFFNHSFKDDIMQAITISELVAARIAAKRAEDAAIKARREIDEQITNLLRPTDKLEGTVSEKTGEYKISVVYKLTRSVDTEDLQKVWDKLTAEQQGAFKWKADVSTAALRKLDDKALTAVSKLITSKPASPTITIEAI